MNKKYLIIIILIIISILYSIFYNYCNDIKFQVFDSGKPGPRIFIIGGTHGNEPAGTVGLNYIINEIKNEKLRLARGTLIILPNANKSGLIFNNRYMLHRILHRDLNRNYPHAPGDKPLDVVSKKITKVVSNVDWVLDFHEGWGYSIVNKESMGSGIYPGYTKESINIAKKLLNNINQTIKNKNKKFIMALGVHPHMKTLKNYAKLKNKHYILIETTGQNNIQPIKVRRNQVINIVRDFLISIDCV